MSTPFSKTWYREQLAAEFDAKAKSKKRMITQLYDAMVKSKIGPNEWEQKFIKSVYQQVKTDKRLTNNQDAMLTKLFEKY